MQRHQAGSVALVGRARLWRRCRGRNNRGLARAVGRDLGDAERFIAADGRRFSHTIDPRTGWPIPDILASVTVFDRSCMRADALATALSVLGVEEGAAYAAKRGIAARFVMRGEGGISERVTPAFAAMLG